MGCIAGLHGIPQVLLHRPMVPLPVCPMAAPACNSDGAEFHASMGFPKMRSYAPVWPVSKISVAGLFGLSQSAELQGSKALPNVLSGSHYGIFPRADLLASMAFSGMFQAPRASPKALLPLPCGPLWPSSTTGLASREVRPRAAHVSLRFFLFFVLSCFPLRFARSSPPLLFSCFHALCVSHGLPTLIAVL